MITLLAGMAAIFGILMGVAPLLQARRILKLKSSHDISIGFFSVVVVGQFTWVAYGIALGNAAVIVSNGCGMFVNIFIIIVTLVIRRQQQGEPLAVPADAR